MLKITINYRQAQVCCLGGDISFCAGAPVSARGLSCSCISWLEPPCRAEFNNKKTMFTIIQTYLHSFHEIFLQSGRVTDLQWEVFFTSQVKVFVILVPLLFSGSWYQISCLSLQWISGTMNLTSLGTSLHSWNDPQSQCVRGKLELTCHVTGSHCSVPAQTWGLKFDLYRKHSKVATLSMFRWRLPLWPEQPWFANNSFYNQQFVIRTVWSDEQCSNTTNHHGNCN